VLRVFGSGNDSLVFEDASSWTRGATSGGFVTFTTSAGGNATVIAAQSLVSSPTGPTTGNDTLTGTAGNDVIDLLAGSDSYLGLDGNDSILGNDGADTLTGGAGADTILGGANNDSLSGGDGGDGNDSLSGGDGDDTLNAGSGLDATLYGGAGNDLYMLIGGAFVFDTGGSDTVSMLGGGVETISASAGDLDDSPGIEAIDLAGSGRLLGLTAAAVIRFSDNDVLRVYGRGNDSLVFEDAGWVRGETAGGLITFTNGGATVMAAQSLVSSATGPTTGNDTLTGTAGNDVIDLLAGNDSYLGLNGNDSVLGNDGADTIYGGNGDDTIIGGASDDRIFGEAGNDSIDAGAGTGDSIRYNQTGGQAIIATFNAVGGSAGYNTATVTTASQGNDTIANFEVINGSWNNDSFIVNGAATSTALLNLYGSSGNDTITMNVASNAVMADYNTASGSMGFTRGVSVDLVAGTATDAYGTDSLYGVRGVNGSSLNDTILGSAFDDRFREQGGSDSIDGRGGNDMLDYSGNGSSQSVSVNLATGSANDGRGGTDTIISMEFVRGGSGNDTIIGNTADNELRGNSGSDYMDGGSGFDIADYSNNSSAAAISVNLAAGRANDGLGGTDTLASIEYIRAGGGHDTMVGGAANERFRGNAGNDSIDGGSGTEDILDLSQTNGAVSANLVTGRANDGLGGTDSFVNIDVLYSGTAADTLIGGSGNDIFDGGMNGDLIDGGAGADRVRYYLVSGNNLSVTGGVSVDLTAQRATDGWGGADTLIGIERVTATNFADTLLGNNVSNRFNGLGGSDSIDGGLGSDWLEMTNSIATSGVTVNLSTGSATDGAGGVDSFTSIEHVIGGSGNDHLTGVAQLNRAVSQLRGGAGNDTLIGVEGEYVLADYQDQTAGLNVNLQSGSVNDGLGGVDLLVNISGAMMFGNFADTLTGTSGDDWLAPSGGNDFLNGGDGYDIINYGGSPSGGVSVNLAAGRASDGDGGLDVFTGIEGVVTGYSNDTVIGDSVGNLVSLGAGADYADAGGGIDIIS
jgi:Ca2+-binding RTX toxin-like protein